MSQQIYRTTVGNTAPDLVITCERNGVVIDITGATVTLALRNEQTLETTNTGAQSCTLTTPATGIITYPARAQDFPRVGRYHGSVKITYAGGKFEWLRDLILVLADGGIS